MSINTVELMREYVKGKNADDSGVYGKAAEIAIKQFFNPSAKYANRVTPQSKYNDYRKGRNVNIEIKTGCGELMKLDGLTEINDNLIDKIMPKIDYILYVIEPSINTPIEQQTIVFTRHQFLEMIKLYPKMIRVKKASSGHLRISLQSFYSKGRQGASKKIRNYLELWAEGLPKLADFDKWEKQPR